MTKVCHISTVHPPFDGRIFFKECKSLLAANYDVSLIVSHDKKEVVEGVKIVNLSTKSNRLYRIFIKTFFAFFKALKTRAKIIHFHDPELILVGIILKLFGKKVIYDVHELVFYQIKDKQWIGSMTIRNIIARMYKLVESMGISIFDKVVLAEEGYYEYFEKYYPKKLNKVVILQNYPIISLINSSKKIDKPGKVTRLIYAGGLTKIRGIEEICKAVSLLNDEAELLLLGPWSSEEFKQKCLGYSPRIKYVGLLTLDEVFPYIKSADIGLAMLYPVKNYTDTLLTKGFEYMACGVPMLMSNFKVWEGFFKPYSFFANPLDVNDIVAKLNEMIKQPDLLKSISEKGERDAALKYSWEAESKNLIAMYEDILK